MVDQPKRVVAAIQARMGSQRLPGKALLPIHGRPVIVRIWERLSLCRRLDAIVVACPDTPENDIIAAVCTREGIGCVRGPEEDVHARMLRVAEATSADAIVRTTGDCPLVDPTMADLIVEKWLAWPHLDYVSNVLPRSFPDGFDVELFSVGMLKDWLGRLGGFLPNTFIWSHPQLFRYESVVAGHDYSGWRCTLDDVGDLQWIRSVYRDLPEGFRWEDVVALCFCGCGRRTPIARHTNSHHRLYRTGMHTLYLPGHHRRAPLAERFWGKVEKSDGCWLWRGAFFTCGYGAFSVTGSERRYAHRVAWELFRGPIPAGKLVCHSCDNPRCVRPEHLFLGTHQDNVADMWAKGRSRQQRIARCTAP